MPKMQNGNLTRKISLSQIYEGDNVRKEYRDIEELAQSIKTSGLLQPIAVKSLGKNKDDIEEYELIAGHRRTRAFKYLFDGGDSGFSMIDAIVVSGDKLTLQLVENLQRSDLTAREREAGICQMAKNGNVSQKEIAAMLGKTETYVSRNIRAYQIREIVDKEGIDTSRISTGALYEIATAAGDDIPELLQRIAGEGGSVQTARKIGREYRAEPKTETPETSDSNETNAQELKSFEDDLPNFLKEKEIPKTPPQIPNETPSRKENRLPPSERIPIEFDPPHREVDINNVLVIIKEYIDMAENRLVMS